MAAKSSSFDSLIASKYVCVSWRKRRHGPLLALFPLTEMLIIYSLHGLSRMPLVRCLSMTVEERATTFVMPECSLPAKQRVLKKWEILTDEENFLADFYGQYIKLIKEMELIGQPMTATIILSAIRSWILDGSVRVKKYLGVLLPCLRHPLLIFLLSLLPLWHAWSF